MLNVIQRLAMSLARSVVWPGANVAPVLDTERGVNSVDDRHDVGWTAITASKAGYNSSSAC